MYMEDKNVNMVTIIAMVMITKIKFAHMHMHVIMAAVIHTTIHMATIMDTFTRTSRAKILSLIYIQKGLKIRTHVKTRTV